MRLLPATQDMGIVFRRVDAGAEIRAVWRNTIDAPLCTVLSNGEGVRVGTIEHLMAALAGCGIDNAIVEIDGPEVPAMDGSAAPFVALIRGAGSIVQDGPRRGIKVLKPVRVNGDGAVAELLPDHGFSMSFEIDFDNPVIRQQDLQIGFEPDVFHTELSRARSFCLLDEVDRMQAAGLALGGSLDNAVVISGDWVLTDGGLSFADERVGRAPQDYVAGT
jgi:UDP-3-O-[3-hydroxymyristoyl] N-acetylglucosamine deacetylase